MVLVLTGIAKIWSTFGGVKVLAVADPIAGIPFRWLLLTVGLLELVIAGVCFFSKNRRLATLLVAWLATNFLVYRLGLLWWAGTNRVVASATSPAPSISPSPWRTTS